MGCQRAGPGEGGERWKAERIYAATHYSKVASEIDGDDENRKHLATHKVEALEFEQMLSNNLPGERLGQEGLSGEIQMKKRIEKQPKSVVPAFATETQEAVWWYENRNRHGKQLLAAVKNGEAQVLTKEKLRERIAASRKTPAPVVALRIPAADLALARKQAEQKGLPYQTYIESLLHETLTDRERRKAGS